MGVLYDAVQRGDHLIIQHESTAYGRRKRAWLDAGRDIPTGYVVACGCDDVHCILLGHAIVRPRIDLRTARPIFEHAIPMILKLGIGETVGVAVPDGYDDEAFRVKMSSLLRRPPFYFFRWGARLRNDGIVIVHKLGTWATKKRGHEKPVAVEGPRINPRESELRAKVEAARVTIVPTNLSVCLGCGEDFESRARICCSVECSRKYRRMVAALANL